MGPVAAVQAVAGQADCAMRLAPVRSRGSLHLALRQTGGRTVLSRAYQAGCMRVRLPRQTARFGEVEAVLINTAGGLAEGDVLDQSIGWEAGACAAITAQAAERVYRAMDQGASISTRLAIGAGAQAAWMPQETILFDAARLSRSIDVDMAPDARFLGLEAVVLGRAAMGEKMVTGHLRDTWRIRRGGRLIYTDALDLGPDIAAMMARPALGGGAGAFATVLCVEPDAGSLLAPLRAALADCRGRAAASGWNGMLAVRLLAGDAAALRHDLSLALTVLRRGALPPRVWSC